MSISALSEQCAELFCCLTSAISNPEELATLENHFLRFNLWVRGNDAIFDKLDSLDWSLVLHSIMQELLEDLLKALNSMYSIPCERTKLPNATQVIFLLLSQPVGLALMMMFQKA